MPARFGDIKFNLMRAVEMFEDMNYDDMDVTAPPSSHDYYKENEVAHRLNDFLSQLVEEGVFDDCELRDTSSGSSAEARDDEEAESDDDESDEDSDSTPRSEGFAYGSERSTPRSSGFDSHSGSRSRSSSRRSEGSGRYASSGSRGSFGNRFKRYIRRIIPGGRRSPPPN